MSIIKPLLPCAILIFFLSCQPKELTLSPVSYAEFEVFVDATQYKTDAEKYGWSIVQINVFDFETVESADWKKPDGQNRVTSKSLPVTQVSYNDAKAYCQWSSTRLPSYEEYWEYAKKDDRPIVTDGRLPISDISDVNIIGNVWDITEPQDGKTVRLAGGSLFCSPRSCDGTKKERELIVDTETGNIHIGFSVLK